MSEKKSDSVGDFHQSETEGEHRDNMEKLKSSVEGEVAKAKEDKGLVLCLTGDGKGKSSSGFGMVLRCLGHGMRPAVVQFIKGDWDTGEKKFFEKHLGKDYVCMGGGFTWESQNREADIERTLLAWESAKKFLEDDKVDLVLLDEINVVVNFAYLEAGEVVKALKSRPSNQHVVITGRGAAQSLIGLSDTVSITESPKHAFEQGIRAQKGIEM